MAESYNSRIDTKPHNAYYDRPNTLSLLPDVKNKIALDVGCGPGKYTEALLERGARVIAVDFSDKMINHARNRIGEKATFHIHDMNKPFSFVEDQTIDIVLSALVFEYLYDWNPPLKEFHRMLKPKGIVILSIQHPFNDYRYFRSDNYFEIEKVGCTWKGFDKPYYVECYRRSLNDVFSPITNNGFLIEKILEPKPVEEFRHIDKTEFESLNKFPIFLCIKALKYPTYIDKSDQ